MQRRAGEGAAAQVMRADVFYFVAPGQSQGTPTRSQRHLSSDSRPLQKERIKSAPPCFLSERRKEQARTHLSCLYLSHATHVTPALPRHKRRARREDGSDLSTTLQQEQLSLDEGMKLG